MIFDTLISANKKIMWHPNVCGINQWLFDNCEPEYQFSMLGFMYDESLKFIGFQNRGQYRLTTYEKAKKESGDYK
jgi:hypothetical protein